jgi:hypothetical protein
LPQHPGCGAGGLRGKGACERQGSPGHQGVAAG